MTSIETYRKRAKQLMRWHRDRNYSVGEKLRLLDRYRHLTDAEILSMALPLTLAQEVVAVEAGFKTAWFDNRLQVNGAIFHYQYKNQQIVDVRPDGEQPLINLPKSKIDGGELEIITRPVRSLTLRAGLGFLNAKVQDGAVAGGTVSVSGHKLPEAPDVSGTVAADWVAFVVPQGNLTLHLDSSFASKQYFELVNEDRIAQQAYGLLNGRLTWHGPDDRWDVGVRLFEEALGIGSLPWRPEHRFAVAVFGVEQDRQHQAMMDVVEIEHVLP